MNGFRLTVVVDNKAAEGLVSEHGYALHIETPAGNIMLDTGQKNALMPNMQSLGLASEKISSLVLSHGHYDHSGGINEILAENNAIEIYLHAAAFQPRYSFDGSDPTSVRMPLAAMEAIMRHGDARTHWLTKPTTIAPNIGLTGPITRQHDFENTGGSFYLDPDGREIDPIKDDVALWLHGQNGLVICVGCCHSGLLNTLDYITARTGESRIDTIIGGLHLVNASSQRLEKTVEALQQFEIGRVIACHCSGEEAVAFLQQKLDAEVGFGYAGMVLEI